MNERRNKKRTPRRLSVTSACGAIDGRTTNVSEGGFHLQNHSARSLTVGDTYKLRLRLGSLTVEAQAKVVSSESDVFYETGALTFTELSQQARQELRRLTQKQALPGARAVGLGRMTLVQKPPRNRSSVDHIG